MSIFGELRRYRLAEPVEGTRAGALQLHYLEVKPPLPRILRSYKYDSHRTPATSTIYSPVALAGESYIYRNSNAAQEVG